MIGNETDYVPALNDGLSITPFDKDSYLLCIDDKNQTKFIISPIAKHLLDQVDGKKNIREIAASFNTGTYENFDAETIVKIFNNRFNGYGVFKKDSSEKIKVKDNYLKLRFDLVPEKLVAKIVQPSLFLFGKKFFLFSFCSALLMLSCIFIKHVSFREIYTGFTSQLVGWLFLCVMISCVLHEFGHAGACIKFGAKNRAIGFGFYLLMPVLYADVSDAWRLNRNERLIVDLAGIYIQLLCCVVLAVCFYVTHVLFCLQLSFLIFLTAFVNINPFLRCDGYWALCDLIGVPNLRENSLRLTKQFFRKIAGKPNKWNASRINYFLVIYSICSATVIAYFLFVILIYKKNAILYFPVNVYSFFTHLFFDFHAITFQWLKQNLTELILPFVFYLALYRLLKKVVIQLKNKEKALG